MLLQRIFVSYGFLLSTYQTFFPNRNFFISNKLVKGSIKCIILNAICNLLKNQFFQPDGKSISSFIALYSKANKSRSLQRLNVCMRYITVVKCVSGKEKGLGHTSSAFLFEQIKIDRNSCMVGVSYAVFWVVVYENEIKTTKITVILEEFQKSGWRLLKEDIKASDFHFHQLFISCAQLKSLHYFLRWLHTSFSLNEFRSIYLLIQVAYWAQWRP